MAIVFGRDPFHHGVLTLSLPAVLRRSRYVHCVFATREGYSVFQSVATPEAISGKAVA